MPTAVAGSRSTRSSSGAGWMAVNTRRQTQAVIAIWPRPKNDFTQSRFWMKRVARKTETAMIQRAGAEAWRKITDRFAVEAMLSVPSPDTDSSQRNSAARLITSQARKDTLMRPCADPPVLEQQQRADRDDNGGIEKQPPVAGVLGQEPEQGGLGPGPGDDGISAHAFIFGNFRSKLNRDGPRPGRERPDPPPHTQAK